MSYEITKATLPVERMSDLQAIGDAIAQSGMFGVKNAASGLVVAATCHQQGITLMEFQRTYHIVEGRPSMRADAMLAEFRKLGGKVKIVENNTTRAAADFTFEGHTYPFEYTLEDAKRTGDALKGDGTIKQMWQKRPEDMLWARLVSRSVRRLAPEICSGLYTPEEVSDFEDRPARGADPSPITVDDALARAKVVQAGDIMDDANYCPIGGEKYEGVAWANMDGEILSYALNSDAPEITEKHRAAIRAEIAKREGK